MNKIEFLKKVHLISFGDERGTVILDGILEKDNNVTIHVTDQITNEESEMSLDDINFETCKFFVLSQVEYTV